MPLTEPLLITVLALCGLGGVAWLFCAMEPLLHWLGQREPAMMLRLDEADLSAVSEELVSR